MHRLAREDLDAAYSRMARHAPHTAAKWVIRFTSALFKLEYQPHRCGVARENRRSSIDLREFHFGKKPNVFRVIFTNDGDRVRVFRILRPQRRPLSRKEIDDASHNGESLGP